MRYRYVFFFEESERNGGIAEYTASALLEKGWSGKYISVCADGFIKAASVKSSLNKIGLDKDSMTETVKQYWSEENNAARL